MRNLRGDGLAHGRRRMFDRRQPSRQRQLHGCSAGAADVVDRAGADHRHVAGRRDGDGRRKRRVYSLGVGCDGSSVGGLDCWRFELGSGVGGCFGGDCRHVDGLGYHARAERRRVSGGVLKCRWVGRERCGDVDCESAAGSDLAAYGDSAGEHGAPRDFRTGPARPIVVGEPGQLDQLAELLRLSMVALRQPAARCASR